MIYSITFLPAAELLGGPAQSAFVLDIFNVLVVDLDVGRHRRGVVLILGRGGVRVDRYPARNEDGGAKFLRVASPPIL